MKSVKRKRGAPKAKQPKVPPRSTFAALIFSVQMPALMRERLLLAARGELTLLPHEFRHLARDWHPKRKGKIGRLRVPDMVARGESLGVAKYFIWAAYAGRKPDDRRGEKEAMFKTTEKYECSPRTVEKHKAVAKETRGEEWWRAACRLARKKKYEKLLDF